MEIANKMYIKSYLVIKKAICIKKISIGVIYNIFLLDRQFNRKYLFYYLNDYGK